MRKTKERKKNHYLTFFKNKVNFNIIENCFFVVTDFFSFIISKVISIFSGFIILTFFFKIFKLNPSKHIDGFFSFFFFVYLLIIKDNKIIKSSELLC
jgi:hypothetical protein